MKSGPFIGIALTVLLLALVAAAQGVTTSVHIVLYAADGFTVLNETTVDYQWMEANLPVLGDGRTHYYLQGPVFVDNTEERWNPGEDANILEKDMGAVKGTDLRDLCELVGGMEPGDTVTLRASDGFSKTFAYENVYEPPSRQGQMVITWYRENQSYVPGYADGMRLVFFADTSTNPWGVHALGNQDWRDSAAEEYWYYYYQGQDPYPTTTGLSIKYISEIQIQSSREPAGSIEVSSDPAGARVFLDDTDTGSDTPCTLDDLPEGSYTLTVRKDGYLDPGEQMVEVVAGKKAPVRFELIIPPASGDAGGSGSGGDDRELDSGQAYLAGGQLSGGERLHVNGSIILLPSLTSPFMLSRENQTLGFGAPPDQTPSLLRLYLFIDGDGAGTETGTGPGVFIVTGGKEVQLVRSYTENGDNEDIPYTTTLVFELPPGEDYRQIIIGSRPAGSGNLTVTGGLLVAGFEEEDLETQVLVREGADVIGEVTGQESPLTQAEFSRDTAFVMGGNVTLWTVSTPGSARGNLSFYLNGMQLEGSFVPGEGAVTVYKILPPKSPGPSGFRMHISTSGEQVTNRLAILTISNPRPPGESPVPATTPIPDQSVTEIPTTQQPEVTTGETLPAEEPAGTDPVGNFLSWLFNVFLVLSGQPPEPLYRSASPVPAENVPGVPARETTGSAGISEKISVSSLPGGAELFIDGRPTGLVTPCDIEIPPGFHTVRLVKEGYLPFEQQVSGQADVEVILHPDASTPDEADPEPPAPGPSHHGGLFIRSYPASVEIRIDNVPVGTSAPVLVYPLKEGVHTIQAGIPAGNNGYSARETIRTWVFPDAVLPVEFNLMDAPVQSLVNITGESRPGTGFTVNGYYPVRKVPERVELAGAPSFITLIGESSYLSFEIPPDSKESGVYSLPEKDPPSCTLSIQSVPEGAEVFLDGTRMGLLTPATIPNVSAGYHRISIASQGRLPVTELIHIPDSQCREGEVVVRYTLAGYPSGTLNLASDPPGAAISIRGLKTGEVTPCTIEGIPIGIWEVTFSSGKSRRGVDAKVEPESNRTYAVVFD
ncbi:MAG: PEGA domain-containing protein [Methanoregulaceae archaeon]|nr:PEGA domain-containing protein [Methanoregulaceae archaeon]